MKLNIKNETILKILKWGGYSLFSMLCFIIFLIVTFPVDEIKGVIEKKAEEKGIFLSIGHLSMSGIGGVSAEDLHFALRNPLQKELKINVEKAKISLSLLKYLIKKKIEITFDGDILGGEVKGGKLKETENGFLIEVQNIKDVGLEDFKIPFELFSTEIKGIFNGKLNFFIDKKNFSNNRGSIEINFSKAKIIKPEIKTKDFGNFVLTDINLDSVIFSGVLDKISNIKELRASRLRDDDTVFYIQKGKIEGREIELVVAPNSIVKIPKNRNFNESEISIEFAFSLSEEFFSKKEKGETPNNFLKTLLSTDMKWKNSYTNGFYGVYCSGIIKKPICIAKRPMVGGRGFTQKSIGAVKLFEEKKEKPKRIEIKKEEDEEEKQVERKIKMVPIEGEEEKLKNENEQHSEEGENNLSPPKVHGEIKLQKLQPLQPYAPKIYSIPSIKRTDILHKVISPVRVREEEKSPQEPSNE